MNYNRDKVWYTIPGFRSYDINSETKEVRSCKHYKTGFHIMTQRNGKVTLVNDQGNSQSIHVDTLYQLTFYSGHPLEPRGTNEMYCGGMQRVNRKKKGSKYDNPNLVRLVFGGENGITTTPY